jgi:hypothetical protein
MLGAATRAAGAPATTTSSLRNREVTGDCKNTANVTEKARMRSMVFEREAHMGFQFIVRQLRKTTQSSYVAINHSWVACTKRASSPRVAPQAL